MWKILVSLSLFLVICGCGFKQRGAIEIPDSMQSLYITPNEPYEPLQRELRYRLTKYKVKIIPSPKKDVLTLGLSKPEINEQVLAFGTSGQGQRLKLIMKVSYTFNGNSRTITRTREMTITNNLLLSNEGEKQIIQKELLAETVNELIRQITTRPDHKAATLDSSKDDNPC